MTTDIDTLVAHLTRLADYSTEAGEDEAAELTNLAIAAIRTLQTEKAELREAHKAILALDGPYCDNCHSNDIGDAFQIARQALSNTGEMK